MDPTFFPLDTQTSVAIFRVGITWLSMTVLMGVSTFRFHAMLADDRCPFVMGCVDGFTVQATGLARMWVFRPHDQQCPPSAEDSMRWRGNEEATHFAVLFYQIAAVPGYYPLLRQRASSRMQGGVADVYMLAVVGCTDRRKGGTRYCAKLTVL